MNEDPLIPKMPEPPDLPEDGPAIPPLEEAPTWNEPEQQSAQTGSGEAPNAGGEPRLVRSGTSENGDYVSEIRQSLASDETGKGGRKTGGLIQRITGSLRRTTGSLKRVTGPLKEPDTTSDAELTAAVASTNAVLPEMEDDFVTGRLGGATVSPPDLAGPRYQEDDEETWLEKYAPQESAASTDASQEAGAPNELLAPQEFPTLNAGDEAPAAEEDALSLLESGAIAAQQQADEDQAPEPDWMAEIRQEASQQEAQTDITTGQLADKPAEPHAPTSPLRTFFTGILRGTGEKRKQDRDVQVPDEVVTGRLERSLGIDSQEESADEHPADEQSPEAQLPQVINLPAPEEPEEGWGPEEFTVDQLSTPETVLEPEEAQPLEPWSPGELEEAPASDFSTAMDEVSDDQFAGLFGESAAARDENAEPEGEFDARFGLLGADAETSAEGPAVTYEPETGSKEDEFSLTPEEEALLFGGLGAAALSAEQGPTYTPEDVWGETPENQEPSRTASSRSLDDAYAEAYLTGQPMRQVDGDASYYSSDQMLHDALEKSAGTEAAIPVENIREIALEGYQDEGETYQEAATGPKTSPVGAAGKAGKTPAAEEEVYKPRLDFRDWLAARTPFEKFLLIEAVVVALALVISVPFFIYQIFYRPVAGRSTTTNYLEARPLPENLPTPTGLTLTGGWYFQLAKSTFTDGKWQPTRSEWLEGTELRRVVALPWNQQSEAVIKTLKAGDHVSLDMSNNDSLAYTVEKVERLPADDKTIYTVNTPSLLIILYQENAKERWVVTCKP